MPILTRNIHRAAPASSETRPYCRILSPFVPLLQRPPDARASRSTMATSLWRFIIA